MGLVRDVALTRRTFCLFGVEGKSDNDEREVVIEERGRGGFERVNAEEVGGFAADGNGDLGCVGGRWVDCLTDGEFSSSFGDARELLFADT